MRQLNSYGCIPRRQLHPKKSSENSKYRKIFLVTQAELSLTEALPLYQANFKITVVRKISSMSVTTGVPRVNGQIERINRTIIPVLAKMSMDEPTKWYKYVSKLQQVLNSTYQRSINSTPFELLIGTRMKTKEDLIMKETIQQEMASLYDDIRKQL